MLDLFGIMFSSTIMMLVIIRAVRLDKTEPWFQSIKRREASEKPKSAPWRRAS